MYPLHMKTAAGGFALANDEAEHRSLSTHGYEPKFEEPSTGDPADVDETEPSELQQLRAQGKAAGVKGAHFMGVEKLRAALGK